MALHRREMPILTLVPQVEQWLFINGIVENFIELRDDLTSEGEIFNSDTDTEVIVHLLELNFPRD